MTTTEDVLDLRDNPDEQFTILTAEGSPILTGLPRAAAQLIVDQLDRTSLADFGPYRLELEEGP